ncbi:hypothetical protein GALMADRAFT_60617 [Galerina marginata CBS 339.88]|uniref:Uncharacterized protein n=1 Tax=Galerina marginata (strain CBS 339.88) TaxID=685588 RepID=A0A067TQC9_GALM3|nr:hypothetical protein GALMADRAFT_60617 [Galerina marginata CBS 339.88]
MNPYAQAGWRNPQNDNSINEAPWRPDLAVPPTYGALPEPTNKPNSVSTLKFTMFNQNILNCCVVAGQDHRQILEVQTNSSETVTVISKLDHQLAVIHWNRHPTLWMEGAPFQQPGAFLKLSDDAKYRVMHISKVPYLWIPQGRSGFYLYKSGTNPLKEVARARLSDDMLSVSLEIVNEAFPSGILQPCIVATFLLFSGKPFN